MSIAPVLLTLRMALRQLQAQLALRKEAPVPIGKRGLIVCFSQGGACLRIAAAVAEGLRGAGYAIDVWNLKDGRPPDVQGYDLLGIGSPIYYFHLPLNVQHFVEQLPELDGRPAFSFIVHGTIRGDAANGLRRNLSIKGAREVGYFHCRGEAHVLPLLREGYLFSPDRPSNAELREAKQFGEKVAGHVAGEPFARPPDEPRLPLIYRLEKLLASRWLIEHWYSRLFRVDPSRCTACGLCMEVCPTANIAKNAAGQPEWDRRCLMCLSCEMKCPERAITSAVSRTFPGALIRFLFRHNLRRWIREGGLDYVRVVHRNGRTQRTETGSENSSA